MVDISDAGKCGYVYEKNYPVTNVRIVNIPQAAVGGLTTRAVYRHWRYIKTEDATRTVLPNFL